MLQSGRKLAVVTGGTRGIGAAVARGLLKRGIDVLVTGTRSGPPVPEGSLYWQADFTDLSQTRKFAEEIRRLKPLILINNVGIERNGPFESLSLEDLQAVLNANLISSALLAQAAVPAMTDAGWGRIIQVTSVWSKVGKSHRTAYAASKFGLEGMSACLADELVGSGILVNCVAPGFIDVDATAAKGRGPERNAHLAEQVPMKRMGKPEEVASAICWLASEESSYVSGQTIVVDGGFISSGAR
ncbi:MAG: SDR family NAD(P)-dependent oxidoreductase [Bdellovibrionota bacterium]